MRLHEVQALVWRAIRHPQGVDAFLREADDATRDAFERTFDETPGFDRRARVDVYAQAYFWRLHDVLLDHFSLVAWLCGPARFRNLVTDYVWRQPSIDPDIRRYGERLPAFIAGHAEGARVVGLADVAALEWAMVRAIDAPHPAVLDAATLAALPADAWPQLRLTSVPSAFVGRTRLPFAALWEARLREPTPAAPPAVVAATQVLVWRQGHEVMQRALGDDEAAALSRVIEGCAFASLCEHHDAQQVVAWLRTWLADGLLVEPAAA